MIDIIYQDAHLIAVNKPSGLLSVPGLSSPDNLLDQVTQHFPNSRTVHRLDMSTSGLVLFAQTYPAQKALNTLFATRRIHKTYTALVCGIVQAQAGEIHLPLICDWPNRPLQKVDWQNGKHASSYFTTLERRHTQQHTLITLNPITGRSHQLRLHCLSINHPIAGDQLYHHNGSQHTAPRLMLHATRLEFMHPITQKPLVIECLSGF